MRAPVAVIGFLRKDLLEATLRNLSLADGVQEREVFVYLSAPRNDADKPKTDAVRELAESFRKTTLPNMTIVPRDRNEGASINIRAAVSDTVSRSEGRAIVIEDDVLVSRTFLRYMDAALDRYESDSRVWCINGHKNPHLRVPKSYPYDVYLNPINMAWGWGTWRDRWEAVNFDISDWSETLKDPGLMARLNAAGSHLPLLLGCCASGDSGTWDAQCSYHMVKNGLYAVESRWSQVKNNGMGTAGAVHTSRPNGTISKQKYYNFIPEFADYEEMMRMQGPWMHRFQYSVRDRRPVHFALRCARRLCKSFIGPVNNEPLELH